ncbi:MAG: hypothetical protein FJ390_00170 [Verrucomicrobia bacterium]|nr:hypothetical protein [Verrucomicrobiota bacterium]
MALTYANDLVMDGAGAQLQRIYLIYALSRHLGVSYFHSPIFDLGYQGLVALEKQDRDPNIVKRYNDLFALPSDEVIPENAIVHCRVGADLDFLTKLKEEAKKTDDFHFVKIISASPEADYHFPEMIRHAQAVSPFESPPSSVFRVAIHLRRGDISIVDEEEYRFLPNAYYVTLIRKIIKTLRQLGISFACELYSELPSTSFVITPAHYGMEINLKKETRITPEMNNVKEFDQFPNLKKFINGDPIDDLRALATADLLIMSRSDFSYTAAILNKKGIIVYHPFWHGVPMEWLDGSHEASFSDRLREACQRWAMERENL